MQYPVASLLTILALADSLQCSKINNGHNTWRTGPRVRLEIHPRVEEWPHSGQEKKLLLHKQNEPLNMTCTVVYENGEKEDDTPFDYTVDWKGPPHVNNNPKIERGQSKNTAWIAFERLVEKDAGNYSCMAVSQKIWDHQTTLSFSFYLFVEHKPTYCSPQWFRCHSKNCIMERYVCDGKQDCEEGEDEGPAAGCGADPCLGKILCDDRCIPPEWCCDRRNCSGTFGLRPWPHENHEISYVQTAFYTVIGCAMAFMFIVTILVIAICRVQIKRAMSSRCPQQNRNVICGRRAVPLYDLDVYLNRTADVSYPGGVSIMYNINSDVQFVGRPTEPPPYSEVISEPPREGPPPPYVSCENLIVRVANPRFLENNETIAIQDEIGTNLSLNRNVIEGNEETASDTDLRSATHRNEGENCGSSIPGPQVPIYNSLPQGHTIVNRDTDSSNFSRIPVNNSQSRDSVDSSERNLELSRNHGSTNFDLEYVETDALLLDNSSNPSNRQFQGTRDTSVAWKSYRTPPIPTCFRLSIEKRNKRSDKNWYRQTTDKTIKQCPIREISSHKDSENEGVFLDTDQQDLTPVETSGCDNDISTGFPVNFSDVDKGTTSPATSTGTTAIASREKSCENSVAGCSNSSENSDTASGLTIFDKECGHSEIPEVENSGSCDQTRKSKETEMKFLKQKVTNDAERSGKKLSASRNFLRGIKKQTSLGEDLSSKNSSDTTVCASGTGSVDLPNPRITGNETNSLIRQSSLVLPLRESFIGVQRDS